jgi:hypothetical protein
MSSFDPNRSWIIPFPFLTFDEDVILNAPNVDGKSVSFGGLDGIRWRQQITCIFIKIVRKWPEYGVSSEKMLFQDLTRSVFLKGGGYHGFLSLPKGSREVIDQL